VVCVCVCACVRVCVRACVRACVLCIIYRHSYMDAAEVAQVGIQRMLTYADVC
jgi:hypothetical protein